jgi:hypothetical protein
MSFMTIKLFLPKNDYIIKLSTIVMNFSMCVTTTSHNSHLDYEFKILFMYVMNMYIINLLNTFFHYKQTKFIIKFFC